MFYMKFFSRTRQEVLKLNRDESTAPEVKALLQRFPLPADVDGKRLSTCSIDSAAERLLNQTYNVEGEQDTTISHSEV